jgi:hypothetical protein
MSSNGNDTPSERPPWITTIDGVPPVADLKANPVTLEEIAAQLRRNEVELAEALAHYQSKGRGMSTEEQRFMGQHQQRAEIHRANLGMFEEEMRKGHPEAVHAVIGHACALANALIHLGQFDEAVSTLEDIGGVEADYLRDLAAKWKAADERPNDEECECEPASADEHFDAKGNSTPMKLVARKHFRGGTFRSVTQGRVVDVHTCGTCGHQNARPTEDEEHALLLQERAEAERNVRLAELKGSQARAHLESHNYRGDIVHLAVKEEKPEQQGPVVPTVISQ